MSNCWLPRRRRLGTVLLTCQLRCRTEKLWSIESVLLLARLMPVREIMFGALGVSFPWPGRSIQTPNSEFLRRGGHKYG